MDILWHKEEKCPEVLKSRVFTRVPSRLTAVKQEVPILGADKKERGLWGRECGDASWAMISRVRCVISCDLPLW